MTRSRCGSLAFCFSIGAQFAFIAPLIIHLYIPQWVSAPPSNTATYVARAIAAALFCGAFGFAVKYRRWPKTPDHICGKCGYEMGIKNFRCSECGKTRTL